MKIVVLSTFGNTLGKNIADVLLKHNYEITLVIEKPNFKTRIRQIFGYIKTRGFIITSKIIANFILSKAESFRRINTKKYVHSKIKNYFVEDLNSKEDYNLLKKLKPDLIVLGGTRIIKGDILKIPKKGTINCHPGLLPKFRGVDVILWSIYKNYSVGVTVHYVDERIDMGDIILKKKIKIDKCKNIEEVREIVRNSSYQLTLKAVRMLQEGKTPRLKQNRKYPLYTKMPKKLLNKVEAMIKNGYKN